MATSIFDYASLVWDGRLSGYAAGKLFPLKPNVKDLTGDFFTVTRNGTAWYLDKDGVYKQAAANVPRIEYNANGTYRGLLVEPGATNLALYNNDFSNAFWTKTNTTVASETDAKLGTRWLVTDSVDGSPALHVVGRNSGLTIGTTNAGSKIYAKAGTLSRIRITQTSTLTSVLSQGADINLNTGTVIATNGTTQVIATSVGDGWYEIECGTNGAVTNSRYHVVLLDNSGNASYQGDGTGTLYIARAMKVDNTSICGSDIVTTGSTAARVADVISLTSASSLIGQSVGSIYLEVNLRNLSTGVFRRLLTLSDNTANNRTQINTQDATSRLQLSVTTGGVAQASIVTAGAITDVAKIAIGYATDDFVMYVNGVQIGTDALATVPACDKINIGSSFDSGNQINDHVRSLALFSTRLANATLQSLTT